MAFFLKLRATPRFILPFCFLLGLSIIARGVECPECIKDVRRLVGQGPTNDGSNRTNVNIQIASSGSGSWIDQSTGLTNANIWNGVHDAKEAWNNETINYKFNVNQAAAAGNVDIRIVKADPGKGHVAVSEPTEYPPPPEPKTYGPPWKIILPPSAANWSPAKLKAVIEHELSHPLGLADKKKVTRSCGETIMNHATRTGDPITWSIQPKDVIAANKHYQDRSDCSTWYLLTLSMSTGGGVGYVDPTPVHILNSRTCYYYWTQYDIYNPCDCAHAGEYMGTIYVLEDKICF